MKKVTMLKISDNTQNELVKSSCLDLKAIQAFVQSKKISTGKTYAISIKEFLDFVQIDLKSITVNHIGDWVQQMRDKYKPSTVRSRLAVIKHLYSFLQQVGYITINPLPAFKISNVRQNLSSKIVSHDSIVEFLNKVPEKRYQLLFKMLYLSSARISEILNLKWSDIYYNSITLFGKTGERTIKLDAAFISSLDVLKHYKSEYVFCTSKGKPIGRSDVHQKLKKFSQELGFRVDAVSGKAVFSCHHFRHNSLTHQLENGANIAHLKAVAGHASANTTSIYLGLVDSPDTSKYLTI
jgi:site-specific recombinase XerD